MRRPDGSEISEAEFTALTEDACRIWDEVVRNMEEAGVEYIPGSWYEGRIRQLMQQAILAATKILRQDMPDYPESHDKMPAYMRELYIMECVSSVSQAIIEDQRSRSDICE